MITMQSKQKQKYAPNFPLPLIPAQRARTIAPKVIAARK